VGGKRRGTRGQSEVEASPAPDTTFDYSVNGGASEYGSPAIGGGGAYGSEYTPGSPGATYVGGDFNQSSLQQLLAASSQPHLPVDPYAIPGEDPFLAVTEAANAAAASQPFDPYAIPQNGIDPSFGGYQETNAFAYGEYANSAHGSE
jgi:hypothetical protein